MNRLVYIFLFVVLFSHRAIASEPTILLPTTNVLDKSNAEAQGEGAIFTLKWAYPSEGDVEDWAIFVGNELGAWDIRRITHMNRYIYGGIVVPDEESLKIGVPADGRKIYLRLHWRLSGEEFQYKDLEYTTPIFNSLDSDGDGIKDYVDTDDDNDGVDDENDAFPFDPAEASDFDGDAIGDNSDTDDDNDGVEDAADKFPLDETEALDTDNDGVGNNADTDDDGDGSLDVNDDFPLDAAESLDTDQDGIGNNADTDDDGDGVEDSADAFPLDSSKSEESTSSNDDDTNTDNESTDNSNSSSGGSLSWITLLVGLLLGRFKNVCRLKKLGHIKKLSYAKNLVTKRS